MYIKSVILNGRGFKHSFVFAYITVSQSEVYIALCSLRHWPVFKNVNAYTSSHVRKQIITLWGKNIMCELLKIQPNFYFILNQKHCSSTAQAGPWIFFSSQRLISA